MKRLYVKLFLISMMVLYYAGPVLAGEGGGP